MERSGSPRLLRPRGVRPAQTWQRQLFCSSGPATIFAKAASQTVLGISATFGGRLETVAVIAQAPVTTHKSEITRKKERMLKFFINRDSRIFGCFSAPDGFE
jgi:hypothetical protein